MNSPQPRTQHWHEPAFAGRIGVARRDITPPPGIYARNWGAAESDMAAGVHRPLTCTVLAIRGEASPPLVLAAIDAGWFRGPEGVAFLREPVCRELDIPSAHFMLALSHTHSGPSISPAERDKPGGHLIEPYLGRVRAAIVAAAEDAIRSAEPAVLTVASGRCGLAAERDLPIAQAPGSCPDRYVCGFNPGGSADDTCLVGRITRIRGGSALATLVHYACHPTTLGAPNCLISPDYVGAMRETVEAATGGAPCLFLQGASGELAPRHQYTGDTAVADAHGRALGHAALATLAAMLPPACELRLDGVVSSGAPLAMWRPIGFNPGSTLAACERIVEVSLKDTLRSEQQIAAESATCVDRAARERLHREALVTRTVGSGPTARRSVWLWRLGDVLLVGHADEAYSCLQRDLRAAFPTHAVFVMNVVNGWGGYLCPAGHYDRLIYQVQQSPYARGCLETLTQACKEGLRSLLSDAARTENPVPAAT